MTPPEPLRLRLGGHLNYFDPHQRAWLQPPLARPVVLRALLETLGVPAGEIALVVINGEQASLDATIAPGDRVELFPPMGGG